MEGSKGRLQRARWQGLDRSSAGGDSGEQETWGIKGACCDVMPICKRAAASLPLPQFGAPPMHTKKLSQRSRAQSNAHVQLRKWPAAAGRRARPLPGRRRLVRCALCARNCAHKPHLQLAIQPICLPATLRLARGFPPKALPPFPVYALPLVCLRRLSYRFCNCSPAKQTNKQINHPTGGNYLQLLDNYGRLIAGQEAQLAALREQRAAVAAELEAARQQRDAAAELASTARARTAALEVSGVGRRADPRCVCMLGGMTVGCDSLACGRELIVHLRSSGRVRNPRNPELPINVAPIRPHYPYAHVCLYPPTPQQAERRTKESDLHAIKVGACPVVAHCLSSSGVWESAAPCGTSPTCLNTVPSHTPSRWGGARACAGSVRVATTAACALPSLTGYRTRAPPPHPLSTPAHVITTHVAPACATQLCIWAPSQLKPRRTTPLPAAAPPRQTTPLRACSAPAVAASVPPPPGPQRRAALRRGVAAGAAGPAEAAAGRQQGGLRGQVGRAGRWADR